MQAHARLFRELAAAVARYQKPGEPTYDLSLQLNEALIRTYGMPLSWTPREGGVKDSLERRFLQWVVGTAGR